MSSSSETPPALSSGQHSDEIQQFPALEVERFRFLRPEHPVDEVTAMDAKPSQGEPAYHTPGMDGASGHRREAATRFMSETSARIPLKGERRDADEAFGQNREVAATTELEKWPRVPNTGKGGCFDSLFWARFGSASTIGDAACGSSSEEGPRVQMLSAYFHVECTNFVAKAAVGILSFSLLQDALQTTLLETNVDILEFEGCHFVYKCSYHQGNRYMSLFVRVFGPPPVSSGQLLDEDTTNTEKIEGGLLVELQLREGDRLHFSVLFREILVNFSKLQDKIVLMGTLRYRPRPFPEKGEELFLENIDNLGPSRFIIGQLQESAGNEVPSPITREPMDEDMIEDVVKLAEVIEAGFLDVQADAVTAIAGLTCDAEFREQLSDPRAKKAADALCHASARLLVETEHRPARRQAAVTVANLASAPALCLSLLESDPPLTSLKRGIVDSLVTLSMLRSKDEKEEEIGTRRECMRALISLAESRSTRNMPAMKALRSTTPSGRGAKCKKLMERLRTCRDVLARPATLA